MADLSLSLQRYIDRVLTLDMPDIQASAASRQWLQTRIQNEIEARNFQPALYATNRFVNFGSYFKGTKVKAVDEYDILVVLDCNGGIYSQNGIPISSGLGSANPNYIFNSEYANLLGNVSPTKLLYWLQGVIWNVVSAHGGETPQVDGSAVTARVVSKNLDIDLVPAFNLNHNTNKEDYYIIPKAVGTESWVNTSPRKDIEILNAIASVRDDLKKIIRVCKRIKDQYQLSITSFAIESAISAYAYSQSGWNNASLFDKWQFSTLSLFQKLDAGDIQDPTGFSGNLLESGLSYVDDITVYAGIKEYLSGRLLLMSDQNACDSIVRNVFENIGIK